MVSLTVDGRAMGSATRVVVVGDTATSTTPSTTPTTTPTTTADLAALATRAQDEIAALEARWSRFLPDSDISRVNASAGECVEVHPDTVTLVTAMVQAWYATAGAFDPTLLGALVGLGYASSWDDPRRSSPLAAQVGLRGRVAEVEVDAEASVVRIPVGTALDPGGIGKGLAADLVVDHLLARGASGVLVSIGGDLRVAGTPPSDGGWIIDIDDPNAASGSVARVRLLDGGVATSGTNRRRWMHDGHEVHHLIDPVTCRPADVRSDGHRVVGATVIAGTAGWAESFSKTLMVGDTDQALAAAADNGLAALVVRDDGSTLHTPAWSAYAVDPSHTGATR